MSTNHDSDQPGAVPIKQGSSHSPHGTLTKDEDALADLDEPPDCGARLIFPKLFHPIDGSVSYGLENTSSLHSRKASLLTQALLSSPELYPLSDSEAPHLSIDGEASTTPRTVTPSPPPISPEDPNYSARQIGEIHVRSDQKASGPPHTASKAGSEMKCGDKVEETLGRRRCISFACGKKNIESTQSPRTTSPEDQPKEQTTSTITPVRRPCVLRFACPSRHSPNKPQIIDGPRPLPETSPTHPTERPNTGINSTRKASQQDVETAPSTVTSGCTDSTDRQTSVSSPPEKATKSKNFSKRTDFSISEATRFHEFAGPYQGEDEWTREQTAYRQKMTIDDTLRKENVIRKLAEEVEEEISQDDADPADDEPLEEGDDTDDDDLVVNAASDDGNESDDEEGFGDSDHASDDGCHYQFWPSAATTAATSTEHLEHIRPKQDRSASESSLGISVHGGENVDHHPLTQNEKQRHGLVRKHPRHTSTRQAKFEEDIIGTLDEDRPLQDAFLSNRAKRRQAKLKLIPQDIDPSFPTSDPEAEDEDNGNESDDEGSPVSSSASIGTRTARGSSSLGRGQQNSEYAKVLIEGGENLGRSPPKDCSSTRKKLFGLSSRRLRSPPPPHRRLYSPPPSRRPSPGLGSSPAPDILAVPHLAQRPNLTRTASLPRSGNPFWDQHDLTNRRNQVTLGRGATAHPKSPIEGELHARGPVDIVQGLEQKRQRRREKFWRLHCQRAHAGKERERKCQPGKGAERMREVGKEMQDRFRAYGQNRPNLMLSV